MADSSNTPRLDARIEARRSAVAVQLFRRSLLDGDPADWVSWNGDAHVFLEKRVPEDRDPRPLQLAAWNSASIAVQVLDEFDAADAISPEPAVERLEAALRHASMVMRAARISTASKAPNTSELLLEEAEGIDDLVAEFGQQPTEDAADVSL